MFATNEEFLGLPLDSDGAGHPQFAPPEGPGRDTTELAPPEERSRPLGVVYEHGTGCGRARAAEKQKGDQIRAANGAKRAGRCNAGLGDRPMRTFSKTGEPTLSRNRRPPEHPSRSGWPEPRFAQRP